MEKVTLVQWPESQTCIGCPHGAFVISDSAHYDRVGDSAYLCFKAKEIMDEECEQYEED